MSSKIDFGYLAGLIDGDGYIYICPEKSLRKYPRSKVTIVITSSDRKFLEQIRDQLKSGGIYDRGEKDFHKYSSKTTYNYMINKREDVCRILEGVLPYLILKKEIAQQALDVLKSIGE